MGYRTNVVVAIDDGTVTEQDVQKLSAMLGSFEDFELWSGEWTAADVKWYDYEEDMLRLSKAFPHLRFRVYGAGDDVGDLWEDYWANGYRQHCHARIPPFDPAQMKPFRSAEN